MEEQMPCAAEMPQFKHPRIRGTAGGLDYTVVAKNGNVVLGLKMVADAAFNSKTGQAKVIVGLRVRSTYAVGVDADADLYAANEAGTSPAVVTAWNGMSFEEVSQTNYGYRARTHIGMVLNKTPQQLFLAVKALEETRFYAKVMAWLQTYVVTPAAFTLSYDEFKDALEEQAQALFGHYSAPTDAEEEDPDTAVDFRQAFMERLAETAMPAEVADEGADHVVAAKIAEELGESMDAPASDVGEPTS